MERNRPLIVSVTGWSGSGKTTFCERLIRELISRGFRVAAAKNSHKSTESDKPGSDSNRLFTAGAMSVCLNTENSMTVFYHEKIDTGDRLAELFPDADFIVAEGFSANRCIRIEVTGDAAGADEMKNSFMDADIILYGNNKLAEILKKQLPGESGTVFVHRDNISAAADIVCDNT